MTLQPRATEIPELVRRLGSRSPACVNAARARLAMIGGRAVDALIAALDGDNPRIRLHAMPILSLIQDPRGREPLMAMLLDHDPRMREIASSCLARFPSRDVGAALERLLRREKSSDVRVAALRALVEHYAAGHELAIRLVLAVLFDSQEDVRLRCAALPVVPLLRGTERRGVLRRLRQDPHPEITSAVLALEERDEPPGQDDKTAVAAHVRGLASRDYSVWNEAVHRLPAFGIASAEALIEEMVRRADDPEYCMRAGMALKALGPRRGSAIKGALDRVDEPIPLQVLVDVVGALGEKSLIYRLKELIERIVRRPQPSVVNGFDPMQRVRARAHLELARIGSRLAVGDLVAALTDPARRVELELLSAVERIGTRREIPPLLRAHCREDRFVRERIATVVRTILRRERIRRNHPMFRGLGPDQRRALERILPPPRRRSLSKSARTTRKR